MGEFYKKLLAWLALDVWQYFYTEMLDVSCTVFMFTSALCHLMKLNLVGVFTIVVSEDKTAL